MPTMAAIMLVALSVTAARDAQLDVILYGAYGCVGHLAAFHLANQSGLKWAIAGRNATKLHALASELAAAGGPSASPEILVETLDDYMYVLNKSRV